MSEAGTIGAQALLSTTALLDLRGHRPTASRHRVGAPSGTGARRRPVVCEAWIRDNKAISAGALQRSLVGMTEAQWYRALNGRVSFWPTERRLEPLVELTVPYAARSILHLQTH